MFDAIIIDDVVSEPLAWPEAECLLDETDLPLVRDVIIDGKPIEPDLKAFLDEREAEARPAS